MSERVLSRASSSIYRFPISLIVSRRFQHDTGLVSRASASFNSFRCFTVLMVPKCPTHISAFSESVYRISSLLSSYWGYVNHLSHICLLHFWVFGGYLQVDFNLLLLLYIRLLVYDISVSEAFVDSTLSMFTRYGGASLASPTRIFFGSWIHSALNFSIRI